MAFRNADVARALGKSFYDDPAEGLEVNGFKAHRRTSRGVWRVDIARSSIIIKSVVEQVNIHAEATKANKAHELICSREQRIKGRV